MAEQEVNGTTDTTNSKEGINGNNDNSSTETEDQNKLCKLNVVMRIGLWFYFLQWSASWSTSDLLAVTNGFLLFVSSDGKLIYVFLFYRSLIHLVAVFVFRIFVVLKSWLLWCCNCNWKVEENKALNPYFNFLVFIVKYSKELNLCIIYGYIYVQCLYV